jgi:hypothetical protein
MPLTNYLFTCEAPEPSALVYGIDQILALSSKLDYLSPDDPDLAGLSFQMRRFLVSVTYMFPEASIAIPLRVLNGDPPELRVPHAVRKLPSESYFWMLQLFPIWIPLQNPIVNWQRARVPACFSILVQ